MLVGAPREPRRPRSPAWLRAQGLRGRGSRLARPGPALAVSGLGHSPLHPLPRHHSPSSSAKPLIRTGQQEVSERPAIQGNFGFYRWFSCAASLKGKKLSLFYILRIY